MYSEREKICNTNFYIDQTDSWRTLTHVKFHKHLDTAERNIILYTNSVNNVWMTLTYVTSDTWASVM